jgi:hypothetical protein
LPQIERVLARQKEGLRRGKDGTWVTFCLATRRVTDRYPSLEALADDLSVVEDWAAQ